jgi:protein-S-isoprenylcysteine O-methyltransferase Ste14
MASLKARVWLGFAFLAVAIGLLLFVPAGTIHYWQAWSYLGIFFGASLVTTLYLMKRDPALLERRLSAGPAAETRSSQKIIMLAVSTGFIALLLVPAMDYRFGFSRVPLIGVLVGDLLVAIGFTFIFRVCRENTFASATIEVADGQRVISTGPYAIVRHPMYASALLYLIGTPLALASYWGLIALVCMLPFLIWRLLDEERLLAKELPGYTDYQKEVRFRLVPGVW